MVMMWDGNGELLVEWDKPYSSSLDWDKPNRPAADQMGIFDKFNSGEVDGFPNKHPPGWIEAVIDKVNDDIAAENDGKCYPYLSDTIDWSTYSADEKAAYEWYESEILDFDKWDDHVDEYHATAANEDNVSWDDFEEPDSYDIDGDIDAPEVKAYTGGDNKNGQLKVSTEAIRHFVHQIDKIAWEGGGMLLDASNRFDELDIRPGKFAKAELMRQKLAGNGGDNLGLIGDTKGLLVQVHRTLFSLRESLLQMANSYERTEEGNERTGKDLEERTEEFNKMTEAQFGQHMGDTWGYLGDTGDFGQVSTDGAKTGDTGGDE
ncbi:MULTISPECIES: hypothetical protein [unclassified Micromonospora]|uniref:hypothetical protein n=1 Tax=unclassified Micromonospora TaxID=2617518 RepID=UPI003A89134F